MGEISNTAGVDRGDSANVQNLHQEPEPDEQSSGNERYPHEDQKEDDRSYAITRIGDQESAHHRGNGSARSEARNTRKGIAEDLTHHCHNTANQIKEDESASAHCIFDFPAERPEVNHVADDVHPARVHEHRGEDRNPAVSMNDADGNNGPDPNEAVSVRELFQEYIGIENDDRNRSDSKASQRPRGVAKRYEASHLHAAFTEKNADSISHGAFDRTDHCHFKAG